MSNNSEITRINLRQLQESDIAQLAILGNNRKIWENLRDAFPSPYYREDAIAFIGFCNKEEPKQTFAIEFEGQFAGCVGLVKQNDIFRLNAEIGYWIGEPFWGKGIATEAVKLATKYGFDVLKLERIYAGVFEHNKASLRVLEKAGYKLECFAERALVKNGIVHNEIRYFILK